ncbi:MAG: hypothetical protein AB2693_11825, partial [Candidatus Thiodiazotropha sp.]
MKPLIERSDLKPRSEISITEVGMKVTAEDFDVSDNKKQESTELSDTHLTIEKVDQIVLEKNEVEQVNFDEQKDTSDHASERIKLEEEMDFDRNSDIDEENDSNIRDTLLDEGLKPVDKERKDKDGVENKQKSSLNSKDENKMVDSKPLINYDRKKRESDNVERVKSSEKPNQDISHENAQKGKLLKHIDYSSDSDMDTTEVSQSDLRTKYMKARREKEYKMLQKAESLKEGRYQRIEKDMTKSKWDSPNGSEDSEQEERNHRRRRKFSPSDDKPPVLKKEIPYPISRGEKNVKEYTGKQRSLERDKDRFSKPPRLTEKHDVSDASSAESEDEKIVKSRKKEKGHKKKIKKEKKKENSDSEDEQILSKKKKKKKDKKKKKIKGDNEEEDEEVHKKMKDKKKTKKRLHHNSSEVGYVSDEEKMKAKSKRKDKHSRTEKEESDFVEEIRESKSEYGKRESRRRANSDSDSETDKKTHKRKEVVRKNASEEYSSERDSSDMGSSLRRKGRKDLSKRDEDRNWKEKEAKQYRRKYELPPQDEDFQSSRARKRRDKEHD